MGTTALRRPHFFKQGVEPMARPPKSRKICALPDTAVFGPMHGGRMAGEAIRMTVDEYEAIRLIDYEGLNQEACAVQMDVARTTAQRIYNSAREKIAAALVEGRNLRIEGGEYELCPERERGCGRCRHRGRGRGTI